MSPPTPMDQQLKAIRKVERVFCCGKKNDRVEIAQKASFSKSSFQDVIEATKPALPTSLQKNLSILKYHRGLAFTSQHNCTSLQFKFPEEPPRTTSSVLRQGSVGQEYYPSLYLLPKSRGL